MDPAVTTLLVVAVVAFFFITELIPLAMTALSGGIVLALLGILPLSMTFQGLSDSNIVLFGGMFVVGGALFHTGLAQKIGLYIVSKAGTGENRLMLAVMLIAVLFSSLCSNTGTVASMMPVVIGICSVAKIPVSRQLMPLAYGAAGGGLITMVGTPPNVIVANALTVAGLPSFSFFEFAWAGIPMSIAILIYMMTIGKKLLPTRFATLESQMAAAEIAAAEAVDNAPHDKKKMWISGFILLAVVIVMALNLKSVPLHIAAVIGAVLCVLTKCVTEKQAYESIDWVTIFLLAGMIPVATALDKSGAGVLISSTVLNLVGDNPDPYVLMAVLFLLASGLTQFMSNTAASALLAPIGISIAKGIGASPQAVLMAIAVAAASAFATPVGTPPNTLIMKPGQYRFMDYVKCGSPLIFISFIISMIVVPIVWPFFPK